MTSDRSLDEFAGPNTDDSDPAESTAIWTAVGIDCDHCGETGTRRWLDAGSVVCLDCKEW